MRCDSITEFFAVSAVKIVRRPASVSMRSMSVALNIRNLLLLITTAFLVGCNTPGQVFWSPNGQSCAYFTGESHSAFVLDSDGAIKMPLGASNGGFAWSADSQILFFASADPIQATLPDTLDKSWPFPTAADLAPTTAPASRPATTGPSTQEEVPVATLMQYTAGKLEPLASLGNCKVVYMLLSPDQNWLAILCTTDPMKGDDLRILTYHRPSHHLFTLATECGSAMAFTGPSSFAYCTTDQDSSGIQQTGQIVESTLADVPTRPEAKELLTVIVKDVFWMEKSAGDDDLLITAIGRTFPAPLSKSGANHRINLYHFSRGDGGLVAIAESVGPVFTQRPGKPDILIEKITAESENMPEKHEMLLIGANGANGRSLRNLSKRDNIALWPAWRGGSEITLDSDTPVFSDDKNNHEFYDVIHYHLDEPASLKPLRTLSAKWDTGMKPWKRIRSDYGATTVSTTQSTTQPASQPTTRPTTAP